MAIGKTVDSKAMHPISKVLSSVGVTIPTEVHKTLVQSSFSCGFTYMIYTTA
jgi:hypothetical protein